MSVPFSAIGAAGASLVSGGLGAAVGIAVGATGSAGVVVATATAFVGSAGRAASGEREPTTRPVRSEATRAEPAQAIAAFRKEIVFIPRSCARRLASSLTSAGDSGAEAGAGVGSTTGAGFDAAAAIAASNGLGAELVVTGGAALFACADGNTDAPFVGAVLGKNRRAGAALERRALAGGALGKGEGALACADGVDGGAGGVRPPGIVGIGGRERCGGAGDRRDGSGGAGGGSSAGTERLLGGASVGKLGATGRALAERVPLASEGPPTRGDGSRALGGGFHSFSTASSNTSVAMGRS